jgi:hypothetical protein
LSPRFLIFLLWAFTDRMTIAFESGWIGLAGFLILPYTTAFYALAYRPISGVSSVGWAFVAFGLLLDVFSLVGGDRSRRRRQRS